MRVRAAGLTDVGRVREENEDSLLVEESAGLFVVADGMGGHLGGRAASTLAVETVGDFVRSHRGAIDEGATVSPLENSPVPRHLADAIRAACAAIYERSQADADLHGMGTTVTAMLVSGACGFIAHVGDSRCYLLRGDRIVQITDDHSLVNEQLKTGLITREQARLSRLKNVITRSVGFERDVAVDTFALPIQDGDRFMLCSDGLANFVDDTEMGIALASLPLEEVPRRLVDLANDRGGEDNITVVCLLAQSE